MASYVWTFSSVLWMTLCATASFLIFVTLNSTLWIIGNEPHYIEVKECNGSNITRYPSIGFDSSCTYHESLEYCTSFVTDELILDSHLFPALWKISHVLYYIGFIFATIGSLISISSCRFQIILERNIYNVAGCLQAVAGLVLLVALICYMSGWKNMIVLKLCGSNTGPFNIGHCSLGSAFYYGILAIILILISACISSLAHRSVTSYRVTKRIDSGKKLICIC